MNIFKYKKSILHIKNGSGTTGKKKKKEKRKKLNFEKKKNP
jgi:hypothetical protein